MESIGFFEIRTADPAPPAEAVRLEWIAGAPHITALGDAGGVRLNATPLKPDTPYRIYVGDVVTIGATQLTWKSGAETLVLDREQLAAELAPSPPPARFRLVVTTPDGTQAYPLGEDLIRLGRAPDNDIPINDDHVSRHHAHLVRRAGGYEIVDLESANGLTYQGARIASKRLDDGDDIWIARQVLLRFEATHPAVEAEPAPPAAEAMGEETVIVSRPSATPAEPPAGATKGGTQPVPRPPVSERPPAAPDDATLIVTSRPVPSEEPPPPERPPPTPDDATLIVTSRPAPSEEPTPPERPPAAPDDATLIVAPRPAASEEPPPPERPPAAPDDATLIVTSRPAPLEEPPAPEPLPAAPEDATLIVAPRPAPAEEPPAPEPGQLYVGPQDPTLIVTREATRRPAAELRPPTEPPRPDAPRATEWVDMAQLVQEDADLEFASSTLVRNTQIPHLVIHLGDRAWEAQFTKDRMTLGRGEENDIPIPDKFVSQHHASIERHGERFVIRETESRNGIWLGKERVEEHTLRDGDVLSVGRAKLVFKGGFTRDDLTLMGLPRIDGRPARRPVVFVPGMMGSELWLGSEKLWPNPKIIVSNTEVFSLPGDPRIQAHNVVSEVVIVPGIVKQRQYSGMGDYLEAGLGYTRGKDLMEFAYDWRQDVRLAAQRLAEAIERWGVEPPVTIIAHSLGTLVTRYYVERLGGARVVERILLMGGPHYGTPKGLSVILTGPGMLPFGMGAERMRIVLATFPSAYQILPTFPCITDQDGTYIDALKDDSWLPEAQRPYLSAARSLRREIGDRSSVPTVSIFGYGFKTILRVKIHRRPDGQWQQVEFLEDMAGDTSVPSGSAVLKGSEIHPVFQEHGSLYVDDDVRMRLKVELTRSTTWQRRKY